MSMALTTAMYRLKDEVKYGATALAVVGILTLLTFHSYLLFHTVAEGIGLVVGVSMFLVAWHTRNYTGNGFLQFLGIMSISVSGLDFLHTISYKGIGIIDRGNADMATQVWVAARLLQSTSLLVAPWFLQHRFSIRRFIAIYFSVTLILAATIFPFKIFPRCFIAGAGLTPFKKGAELTVILLLSGALFHFIRKGAHLDRTTFRLLITSIVFSILSEAMFTLYHDPYSLPNMSGHILKIAAVFLIYRAIIVGTLERPFGTLFSSLTATNDRLRRSEEHFRSLFELSGVGRAEADPDSGRFVRVNQHFCLITGYGENELLQLTYAELTHPEDRALDGQLLEAVRNGERSSWSTEKRYVRKDGVVIWVAVFGTLLRDTNGRPLQTIADIIDITDRREAEEKVESVAQFPEENPFPVFRMDSEGTILYANKPAALLLDGWNTSVEGKISGDYSPAFWTALSAGRQSVVDVQHGERWLSLAVVPISGKLYVNVYGCDVTEARSYQEALRISERRYALAQHAANIGTWEWQIASGRVHWSEQIEPLFGMPPGSFNGTNDAFIQCVHPADRKKVSVAVDRCLETGSDYRIEHRIIRPDGEIRWMLESAMLLHDEQGVPERMIGVVFDCTREYEARHALERRVATQATVLADTRETLELVSEQKVLAEEKLRQRHKALEAVYAIITSSESSLSAIGERVVERIASILNLQMVAFHRHSDDTTPLSIHYCNGIITHENAASGPRCSACTPVLQNNRPFQHTGDLSATFPDSTCFASGGFGAYVAVPVLTYQGELVGSICAARREEVRIPEYELHLIEIFAQYLSYEITRRSMQKKMMQSKEMHLLGQLTSGVAHEVRNPLNALMAISEALFKRIDDRDTYGQYMTHIRNQIRRLSRLMEDLLALGRPLRNGDFTTIGIGELLGETVADWKRIVQERQRRVAVELPDELRSYRVHGDLTKLQQVMVNILDNAEQHMSPDGMVTVSVHHVEEGAIELLFRDTGSGIDEENLLRIFDPFFTTRRSGTGLGLSIVKNTIENHGGSIRIVNNDPPPGVTVEISLPVVEDG
jgi:PAS domain S-box-containing protein